MAVKDDLRNRSGFHRLRAMATRFECRGRTSQARRAWLAALRHSVRSRCVRTIELALASLERGRGPARLGLPTTPPLLGPSPARQMMALETGGRRYVLERHHVDGFVKAANIDVLVDFDRERARIQDHEIGLEGRGTVSRLLAAMVDQQGKSMSVAQIFEAAWRRPFSREFDARTMYYNMYRLRMILDGVSPGLSDIVLKVRFGYRIQPGLRMATVRRVPVSRSPRRSSEFVMEFARRRGFLTNRSYCELTGASKSTARRDLHDMVSMGLLRLVGQGRSVRYLPSTIRAAPR